ncbi:MAG: UDP-3-O-(3-hydroxymyristoyl)glucosamine N-acyltransferase [Succinivibrionaceae bacterium]|nr:UDP-3-O-(3-hydroxymyristoyl)glucosamine N-acyltransferase [Succinivibrionaceae bacterium]
MRLGQIADQLGARLEGDASLEISRVANLKTAGEGEISFLSDPRYRDVLSGSRASAVIVAEQALPHVRQGASALVVPDAYVGFARVAQLLDTTPRIAAVGVHPSAVVEEGASLGQEVAVGPLAHIAPGAVIGDGAQIGAGVDIGPGARIGAGTRIYPGARIYHHVVIGERCLIQSNAVIGSDGFGYANERGQWIKIPQVGTVRIGDMVEIGASTCIDRGALDDTVIEGNVIIDNLCQIAHNVRIGTGTAIAGCATFAGSVTVGRYCIIGGKTAFNGHITICDQAEISGGTQVQSSIKEKGRYSSAAPLMPHRAWCFASVRYTHLGQMYEQIRAMEREIKALKASLGATPASASKGDHQRD